MPSPHIPFLTQESLFRHQREPLFFKRRKSDIFYSKKFAMSLIRAIFAFENGREVANLGFVFAVCLHSASTLPSLWVRSGFASGGEEKHKATRQQKHGTNERSLTYLLIGFQCCCLFFVENKAMVEVRKPRAAKVIPPRRVR